MGAHFLDAAFDILTEALCRPGIKVHAEAGSTDGNGYSLTAAGWRKAR